VDAILLSHPDIDHLGALPYVHGKLGMKCPIFATVPVYRMGQMFMYDLYQSHYNSEDFTLFDLDDVDSAFDHITRLKYSQTYRLQRKGLGLTITPYPSGHTVGGTIWRIIKDDEEDIVYAPEYSHRKERHLDGAVFESLTRPHLFITDANNALMAQERRKDRDRKLIELIQRTLRNDGNVLMPVDTAGRLLELAQLLEQNWRQADTGLSAYSIAILNNVSYNVMEFAKAQVEWMSERMMKQFEDNRMNPFQFKHIKLCHSLSEVHLLPHPKVVMASFPDLEMGFARDLFVQWCGNPRTSLIFTSRSSPGTLGRSLIDNSKEREIELEVKRRVPLEGEELKEYLESQKQAKEETTKSSQESSSSDDSDDEGIAMETGSFHPRRPTKHDYIWHDEKRHKNQFFKTAGRSFLMYPFHEEKITYDDYGEPIRLEDYITEVAVEEKQEKEEPMETQEEVEEKIPSKCTSTKEVVNLKCSTVFIDYEGRSDGESVKRILTLVEPRQVILIHGSLEASQHLKEFCHSTVGLPRDKVVMPALGECVNVSSGIRVRQVRLRDSLMNQATFSTAKDVGLAWVDCQVCYEDGSQKESGEPGGISEERVPILDALPPSKAPQHKTVFINPPRLSDFKQTLNSSGIEAEFSGGALICNGRVAITKPESGRICIEGAVCKDFYEIRELLYKQFAIL
jgi:cleavage and polyadenylation specificity factor subunit 2